MAYGNITITHELRPCYVYDYHGNKRYAMFHCWSQRSDVIAPSPLKGGHVGGVVSRTVGIVEYEDGRVHEINAVEIVFCDTKMDEFCFTEPNAK